MKKAKLNANAVGATSSRPHFEGMTKNNQKGITLIALIITIIVMLVLVGVTINVALNGGLFEKGEKAAYQTNASTIKEMVALKKAEVLAGYNGKSQDDYKITMNGLELTGNLKEFETKLTVSKDGTLYYIKDEVTEKEIKWLEEIGITENKEPIVGKTPLRQIKHGDVWTDVSFASMTLSNTGITLPATEYVEEDETGTLEQPVEVEINDYGFLINGDDSWIVIYADWMENDGSYGMFIESEDFEFAIFYFFSIGTKGKTECQESFRN